MGAGRAQPSLQGSKEVVISNSKTERIEVQVSERDQEVLVPLVAEHDV